MGKLFQRSLGFHNAVAEYFNAGAGRIHWASATICHPVTYLISLDTQPCPKCLLTCTREDGELLFSDFQQGRQLQKKGYQKVKGCCKLAKSQGYQYVWVDTYTIDKSSSAELSEAINSMFAWYRDAAVCYAYLDLRRGIDHCPCTEDCTEICGPAHRVSGEKTTLDFTKTRWITRGWTLQELIAPRTLEFYSAEWKFLGTRQSLADNLSEATRIPVRLLSRSRSEPLTLDGCSIAERMSWASTRQTTRPEDIAYCLLGLFNVHIPLLYGEGQEKAFFRLQEEIMKHSMDHSILAWAWGEKRGGRGEVFEYNMTAIAPSPAEFGTTPRIVHFLDKKTEPFDMTNKGLRITVPVIQHDRYGVVAILTNCRFEDSFSGPLGIKIMDFDGSRSHLETIIRDGLVYRSFEAPFTVPNRCFSSNDSRTIYLQHQFTSTPRHVNIDELHFPIWFDYQFRFDSGDSAIFSERTLRLVPHQSAVGMPDCESSGHNREHCPLTGHAFCYSTTFSHPRP